MHQFFSQYVANQDTNGEAEGEYVPKKMAGVHVFKDASGNFGIVPKVINVEAVNALKKQ